MNSKWKKTTLGSVLNFRRGHDLPKSKMQKGKYPVIGSNGQIGYHNEYTTQSPVITIGRSGNIGKPIITHENAWAHNTTLYVDDLKGNNPEYIYYFLQTLNLEKYGGGSAVPTLNRNHIHPIKTMIPKLNTQKVIAGILSALDDKIECNNKINKNLEEQAQALFKHWFVDFEFPNEEGKPYKSSDGKMVESELGLIPKGWKVEKLNRIIKISSGKRPKVKVERKSSEYNIEILGASGVMGYTNDSLYTEKILVIGRVGTHGVIQRVNYNCWTSDNTLVIKTNYYNYISQVLNNIDYRSLNRGSTQPLITQTDIKNTDVVIPKEEYIGKFENLNNTLFGIISKNHFQNQVLANIRDTLLPKLMSGEIEVPIEE